MSKLRFILPDRSLVAKAAGEPKSYAINNYYGNGPIAYAKRQRFRRALNLASDINAHTVIDMGTGDGVLLPTLSRYYERVVGVDTNQHFINQSLRLVQSLHLDNVELICFCDVSFQQLREKIGTNFELMLLLETLEHVGNQPDIWGSKIDFLRSCFSLLQPGGTIIVTVPKMVGGIMLFKNLIQRFLGRGYDVMTFRQLLRSSLFRDTDELESLWCGGHVGFNHLKLDEHLRKHFTVHHRSESLISVFYVLGRGTQRLS